MEISVGTEKHHSSDHTGIRQRVNTGEFPGTRSGCVGWIFPEEAAVPQGNKP